MSKQNPKLGPHDRDVPSDLDKDPDERVTGRERMTATQASTLKTLCEEAGEDFDPELTGAEASKRIDALQQVTGRGRREDLDSDDLELPERDVHPPCRSEDLSPDDFDE
jgi:hypothetical protein